MKVFNQRTAIIAFVTSISLWASADIGFGMEGIGIPAGSFGTPPPNIVQQPGDPGFQPPVGLPTGVQPGTGLLPGGVQPGTGQGSFSPGFQPFPTGPTQPAAPPVPVITAAQQARNDGSFAVKMPSFAMKLDYDCPMFSNSPYEDAFEALNTMRTNLDGAFGKCEDENVGAYAMKTAEALQKAISDAQTYQSAGQNTNLALSAQQIVKLATGLQSSLTVLSQAKTRACYKDDTHYTNALFAINNAFQSFSPLLVGLVSQNNALAVALRPALKIFAGADAISKSLVMLEQIQRSAIQFRMSIPENRVNTIHNVCQFMKLYNRLTYLRMGREMGIAAVQKKLLEDISTKNRRVLELGQVRVPMANHRFINIKGAALDATDTATNTTSPPNLAEQFQNGLAQPPVEVVTTTTGVTKETTTPGITFENDVTISSIDLYNSIIPSIAELVRRVRMAVSTFNINSKDDIASKTVQCQLAVSTLDSVALKQFKIRFSQFAKSINDTSDALLLMDSVDALDKEVKNAQAFGNNWDMCSQFARSAMQKISEFVSSATLVLNNYKMKINSSFGAEFAKEREKLAAAEQASAVAKANYENWKVLTDFVPFEASEVEKRSNNLHRFLFDGPEVVVNECRTRKTTDKPCGVQEEAAALFMASYEGLRNKGPIYELLRDDERAFEITYKELMRNIRIIQEFEEKTTLKEAHSQYPMVISPTKKMMRNIHIDPKLEENTTSKKATGWFSALFSSHKEEMRKQALIEKSAEDLKLKAAANNAATNRAAFDAFAAVHEKNVTELTHITPKFLIKEGGDHTFNEICAAASAVLKQYDMASTHLMSSKSTCDMIKPVLGLDHVSKKLKDYCLAPDNNSYSKIDAMIYRLIGEYDKSQGVAPALHPFGLEKPSALIQQFSRAPLETQRSPRQFFMTLLPKYLALECYP